MKHIYHLLIILFLLTGFTLQGFSLTQDEQEIRTVTNDFLISLSKGDTEGAINQLSPNMSSELKDKIRSNLKGNVTIGINKPMIEKISENQYKSSGKYVASGEGWSKSGFSTYFLYEKVNGKWTISDTDIYTASSIAGPFMLIFGLLIPYLIFQIRMLINCAKKANQPGKIKWLFLILMIPFASILYYFTGRKTLA